MSVLSQFKGSTGGKSVGPMQAWFVTASRTWSAPCDGKVRLTVVGAGGAGAAGANGARHGGSAGACGQSVLDVTQGDTFTLTIGAGTAGNGGATTVTGPGGVNINAPGGYWNQPGVQTPASTGAQINRAGGAGGTNTTSSSGAGGGAVALLGVPYAGGSASNTTGGGGGAGVGGHGASHVSGAGGGTGGNGPESPLRVGGPCYGGWWSSEGRLSVLGSRGSMHDGTPGVFMNLTGEGGARMTTAALWTTPGLGGGGAGGTGYTGLPGQGQGSIGGGGGGSTTGTGGSGGHGGGGGGAATTGGVGGRGFVYIEFVPIL